VFKKEKDKSTFSLSTDIPYRNRHVVGAAGQYISTCAKCAMDKAVSIF